MLYLSVLLESWLEGRCSLEKGVEATGMTAFGGSSRKVKWRTWENFIKSELKLVSVYQELLHRDIFRKGNSFLISKHSWTTVRCILPGLKRRIAVSQWSKVYLEIKVRSVENPKRNSAWSFFCWYWWWLVHCPSQRSLQTRDVKALHVSICWQALWSCWFPFPKGTSRLPTVSKLHSSSLLTDRPANSPNLTWTSNRIYGVLPRGKLLLKLAMLQ